MSRYRFDVGQAIENLTPTYLQGRRFRNLLKALASPLQSINENFQEWAHDMEIANKVTSQKILLEKYLTNSLKQYFLVQDSNFVIYHKNPITVNLYVFGYGKSTDGYKQLYAYNRSDTENADNMTYSYRAGFLGSSFYVSVPQFNKSLISQDEYEAKIKTIINRYRLASKNYKLIYQS